MMLLRALLLIPVAWADRLMDWIAPIRHLTPVDLVTPTDVPAAGAQAPQPPRRRAPDPGHLRAFERGGGAGRPDRAAQFAAHGDSTPQLNRPPRELSATADPLQERRGTEVSNTHDTYERALRAVSAALDALAGEKSQAVTAFDPAADSYDHVKHCVAAAEQRGVTDALAIVTGMLADYRAARAGAA